ncbi:hypothetical protein [Neisseria weaveri]|uniref:hypothetical protein n=1 Tax=Neisseria weaveri TaxID=28091 RepID=UPI000D2FD6A4|nr:hypothetical protein [Neisseria weaveri]
MTSQLAIDKQENNPFNLSKKYLMVVTFTQSSSKNFRTALLWAKSAAFFDSIDIDKETVYCCAFDKTPEQAGMASVFLNYVENWNGKQIYINGRIHSGSIYDLLGVLDCYQKSQACPNAKSHCCFISDDIFLWHGARPTFEISLSLEGSTKENSQAKKFVMPCTKLRHHRIEKETYLGSWDEQIAALAVKQNVDWCPSFDIGHFRQYE